MNNEQLKVDGLDDACIGTDYRDLRLVYSIERIVQILMTRDGMEKHMVRHDVWTSMRLWVDACCEIPTLRSWRH